MRSLPATLPILFVCEISFLLGHGLIMTLLGVRMSIEGFPSHMAGLLMSSFSLGFVLGSYLLEKRIRSVGHIRVFAACAGILAVTAMLHGLWVDAWAWLVWRLLGGVATAGMLMVMESWVSGESTNDNPGGQWMLNLADPAGPALFSLVGMLFALALVPLSIVRIHGPRQTHDIQPQKIPLKTLFKRAPVGLVGAFTAGLMVQSFFAMTPFYGQEIGLTTGETARFMAITTMVALFAQWGLGRLSDHIDRRKVILGMAVVMTISGVLVSMLVRIDFWLLVLVACFHTAMLHTLYALSLAHTNDWLEPGEIVAANAKLMIWYGIGSIIGPFSASLVMQAIGPDGLWMFLGGASLALALFVALRLRRRPGEPVEEVEQEPFVAVPTLETPHFTELDPRLEPTQMEFHFEEAAETRREEAA